MDEKDNKNRSESKRRIYIKSCYLWKSIDRNGVKGGTIFIVIFENDVLWLDGTQGMTYSFLMVRIPKE